MKTTAPQELCTDKLIIEEARVERLTTGKIIAKNKYILHSLRMLHCHLM